MLVVFPCLSGLPEPEAYTERYAAWDIDRRTGGPLYKGKEPEYGLLIWQGRVSCG